MSNFLLLSLLIVNIIQFFSLHPKLISKLKSVIKSEGFYKAATLMIGVVQIIVSIAK